MSFNKTKLLGSIKYCTSHFCIKHRRTILTNGISIAPAEAQVMLCKLPPAKTLLRICVCRPCRTGSWQAVRIATKKANANVVQTASISGTGQDVWMASSKSPDQAVRMRRSGCADASNKGSCQYSRFPRRLCGCAGQDRALSPAKVHVKLSGLTPSKLMSRLWKLPPRMLGRWIQPRLSKKSPILGFLQKANQSVLSSFRCTSWLYSSKVFLLFSHNASVQWSFSTSYRIVDYQAW